MREVPHHPELPVEPGIVHRARPGRRRVEDPLLPERHRDGHAEAAVEGGRAEPGPHRPGVVEVERAEVELAFLREQDGELLLGPQVAVPGAGGIGHGAPHGGRRCRPSRYRAAAPGTRPGAPAPGRVFRRRAASVTVGDG
ncbi:hypothetical protein Cus16_0566 [Curtobacterium sp. ER1/6]|nr:hypothetical protein Cus16_0566 [Curtobacterium sp. ER1/6]